MRKPALIAILLALALSMVPGTGFADEPKRLEGRGSLSVENVLADLSSEARAKISVDLLDDLVSAKRGPEARRDAGETVTYLVYLRDRAPLSDLKTIQSVSARREAIVSHLQAAAKRAQPNVRTEIEAQQLAKNIADYRSYWVFNGFAVDGNLESALALAQLPEVESIRPNRVHQLPPRPDQTEEDLASEPEWNIAKIGADQVWRVYGVTGRGVVVANMDTGVDWTHPALQRAYRGYNASNPDASVHDYSWFDPTGTYPDIPGPSQPDLTRYSDHGTHAMGSVVGRESDGSNAVGVAPGAKWIAVKVFADDGSSTDEWIHAGFQWCLAPTDLDGRNADPSRAPDIVSNSWGDDNGADETFAPDLEAWHAAGILSVWASGNEGPEAGTVNSPASFPLGFSVGATNSSDGIASFSSRGPAPSGEIKPEVCAPGANIRSSVPGGLYEGGWNGTSMATPHVAGLAALLMEAGRGSLTIAATQYVITSTAVDLGVPGEDNVYGYGRIDALQAVGSLLASGMFAGTVTDRDTSLPLVGATVLLENHGTDGQVTALTGADGSYALSVREGVYDVTCSLYGYQSSTAVDIEIAADTTTVLDFGLEAQPRGRLKGRVTGARNGAPVPSLIQVMGTPVTGTVDANGNYALDLPIGSYSVLAQPLGPGHRGILESDVQIAANQETRLYFELPEIPRLLVVDAEADSTESVLTAYSDMLDALLYGHDLWTAIQNLPGVADLIAYDVVIWAHPLHSPGYVNAWPDLGAYLDQGGNLLLTGQDIGYWDVGRDRAPEPYAAYLRASYVTDNAGLSAISGLPGSFLEGLGLNFYAGDSLQNQSTPDELAPLDALALPILTNESGSVVGLSIEACDHKIVYLGFGLEGVGPAINRTDALRAMITWLGADRGDDRIEVASPVRHKSAMLGETVSYDLQIVNRMSQAGRFGLSLESPEWPATAVDAQTMQPVTQTRLLQPCEIAKIRLEVQVPEQAAVNRSTNTRLIVRSLSSQHIQESVDYSTTAFSEWRSSPAMPSARYRHSVVGLGCQVYVFGGYDANDTVMRSAMRFDVSTASWETLADRPIQAANSAAVAAGGRIYLLGGYDPDAAVAHLDAVGIYDPTTNLWSTAAPLPEPLSGASAAVVDGRIYLFGGNTPTHESRASYVYDPSQDMWSSLADVPVAELSFARAVALGGEIYVAGGWPRQDALLRYVPALDKWESLAPMQEGRAAYSLLTDDRYIYAAGGGDGWFGLRQVERYDPQADAWITLPSLVDVARSGSDGALLDGRLLVLGGVDDLITTPSVETLDVGPALNGSGFSAEPEFIQPGAVVQYRLVLRNPTQAAIPTQWVHRIAEQLDYVDGSATNGAIYSQEERELTWVGEMLPASTETFEFHSRVGPDAPIGGIITSVVSLDLGGCAPRQLTQFTQVSEPSLARSSKTADQMRVPPGGQIGYTIRIANDSPFAIAAASAVDPIPAHTTLITGSVSGAVYNPALDRIEWQGEMPPAPPPGAAFDWIDMTGGLKLDLGDDACVGPIGLGFPVQFYGREHESIYVNSNGMVLFEKCSTAFTNASVPDSAEPNNFLAPFWDDLNPSTGEGAVYYGIVGSAPHRIAVIEWNQVPSYGEDVSQTFEVLLYEGTNNVVFQYLSMEGARGTGASATVGIEGRDGQVGVAHLYNGSPRSHLLYGGLAIEMLHSDTVKLAVHTIRYDVAVDALAPPRTLITNTATISDGLRLHERSVVVEAESPNLSTSTKVVAPWRAASGTTVTYTVDIVNSGDLAATHAALVDPLPNDLTLVEGSLVGEGTSYDPDLRTILWQGTLAANGGAHQITYQARIAQDISVNSRITNTASLYERGVLLAEPQAGLLVNDVNLAASTKMAGSEECRAGSPISYSLVISNSGLYQAARATLTDTLPAELEMVPGTLSGGEYDAGERAVRWQGSLASGQEHTIVFTANVVPTVSNGTRVTNTAVLDDGHGTQIERSAAFRVLRGDLATSKMVVFPPWSQPGDTLEYRLRLRNTGSSSLSARATDLLPAALTWIPGTLYASGGQANLVGGELVWDGIIPAQGLVIIRYRAVLSAAAEPGVLVNQATLVDEGGISTIMIANLQIGPEVSFLPLLFR